MRLDQFHWLPDDVLAKADRASMGASSEMRTPFLSPVWPASPLRFLLPSMCGEAASSCCERSLSERFRQSVAGGRRLRFARPWLNGCAVHLLAALAGQLDESPLYRDGWFSRETVAGWARTTRHRA